MESPRKNQQDKQDITHRNFQHFFFYQRPQQKFRTAKANYLSIKRTCKSVEERGGSVPRKL